MLVSLIFIAVKFSFNGMCLHFEVLLKMRINDLEYGTREFWAYVILAPLTIFFVGLFLLTPTEHHEGTIVGLRPTENGKIQIDLDSSEIKCVISKDDVPKTNVTDNNTGEIKMLHRIEAGGTARLSCKKMFGCTCEVTRALKR